MTTLREVRRPGYYVEGRYHQHRWAQACASARHLAATFNKTVEVWEKSVEGQLRLAYVARLTAAAQSASEPAAPSRLWRDLAQASGPVFGAVPRRPDQAFS